MSGSDVNKRFPEGELTAKKMVPVEEYGLLKVMEWPDGTVIHLNTKKGEENMRIYHSSGNYSEYRTDGTVMHFGSNNGISYSKGGVTITYDNNMDTKGMGHSRLSVSTDTHIEVAKNASIVINGQGDVHATGHLKISAAGDLSLSTGSGSVVIAAERDIEMKAKGGRVLMHAEGGVVQITSASGDIHLEAEQDIISIAGQGIKEQAKGGNIEEQAKGDIKSKAEGALTEDAGKDVTSTAGGKSNLLASDAIKIKGSKTDVQEGQQVSPTSTTFV